MSSGQKYYSKTAHIQFLSVASIETIKSENRNGYVVLDATTGQFEFSVLIKGFRFEKALMQQHFNDNYMESDQFPKSIFKGTLQNLSGIQFEGDHDYQVTAIGTLLIHGIEKPFKCPGKLMIRDGVVSISSTFDIVISDYGIQVPKVVRENIAKTVKVSVDANLQLLN